MNTLTLQFKKKHIGYSATYMMNGSVFQFFKMVTTIKAQLAAGTYGLEDLITIDITDTDLINLYSFLGNKDERAASMMNADMKTTLLPQLMSIAQGGGAQALTAQVVLGALSTIDTNAGLARDEEVQMGLNWLTQ